MADLLLKRPQLDVFEPARFAVILQTNVAFARMAFVSHVEFVRAPIRTLVGFRELIEVGTRDRLTIEDDFNPVANARNLDVVPFAGGLHGVPCRLDQIIDGARIVITCARRIVDGDFNAVEADILPWARSERSRRDEYPAVAAWADLEVQ